MEKASSFLFSGIRFDRNKFASDIARFKEKKENANSPEKLRLVETSQTEPADDMVSGKKRKRRGKVTETVKGFSVFKSSESSTATAQNEKSENELSREKKELNRQIERDSILRKKHGIHISGHNVPSPLQNFAELSSRFGCKAYLLRNLAELGFKEPTPIQRQAIPVLLSGRECFACAPTGSGKTLAFMCPILMKLKHGSKDGIRAVILCPTRELAAQTTRECKKLAKGKKFNIKLMTKELARSGNFEKMSCDILVSTPLRIRFSMRKRKLDLSRLYGCFGSR